MIDISEFVKELKTYGVMWSESKHKHLIHNRVITNIDMRIMCSDKFQDEYNNLTKREKKQVRESVFKAIRYGENYEKRIK